MSAILRYPTGTPTDTVTLAGPSFGDSKITPQEVKLHMTMGGSIVTTRRPDNESIKFLMTFPNVTHDQWDDLIALIRAANGRLIRMVGPSGTYVGAVMNSPIQRTAPNSDRYSVTIEMVGYELLTSQLILLMDETGYLLMNTGDYILRME